MVSEADKQLQIVYTPSEVSSYTIDLISERMGQRPYALRTKVETVDRYMKPLLPGEVCYISAYTSHGKTAWMQLWARQAVEQLRLRPEIGEVAVYLSWETMVEQLGLYDMCAATGVEGTSAYYGEITPEQLDLLKRESVRRAAMPLWIIGDSLKRRRDVGPLTLPMAENVLKRLADVWKVRPAIIYVDYLQAITPENLRDERRIQVLKNADRLQLLSKTLAAPIVVGCQVGNQVLGRDFKLPEIADNQETSRIQQDADKVITLWYPCKTEPKGKVIEELDIAVNNRLMVMGIRKQRHAASGQVFPLEFDPARNIFTTWQPGLSDTME
jgi:replicative DNA helicase